MKYSRADVTIFLAVMLGGLIALTPPGGQLRAAADLGQGRHAIGWCTDHLGAADDYTVSPETYAKDEAYNDNEDSMDGEFSTAGQDDDEFSTGDETSSTFDDGMEEEAYREGDYGYDAPTTYGFEDYANKADYTADEYTDVEAESSADEYTDVETESSADEYTDVETESSADDDHGALYPESRYGYGMGLEPYSEESATADNAAIEEPGMVTEEIDGRDAAQPSDEQASDQESLLEQKYGYGYKESRWEEKYGYAEEMSGQADERFAGTAERADEQSIAEMENADKSLTNADEFAEPNEFDHRGEASEEGRAMDSAWDGGPNEADLDNSEDMPSENNDPVRDEAKSTEGLDLFGYLPSHLLIRPDQELLRELRCLAGESSVQRQVAFNQYVESLGSEAIEFAAQYENATGSEATRLADDVAACAAFLAVFRLYEQGELGIDEAVDLAERTLDNLSQEWIEGVNDITSDSSLDSQPTVSLEPMTDQTSASAPRKLWQAFSSWAGQWKATFFGVWALRVQGLDWHGLVSLTPGDADAYHLD